MTRAINRTAYWAQVGYKPHSTKQMLFHDSLARFRVPVCGRRFGKSTMAGNDLGPKMFLPKRMFWIVGPTYDLGEKEFRPLWDGLIVKMKLGRDKRIKKAFSKRTGEMFIEMPWQTRVEVRSAQHPESLVGEGLHHVIMSEAAKHREDTWRRFIRPALSDYRGTADFPTTPEGRNWLYKFWQFGQNEDMPSFASWRFPSWDNPIVYPGGINDPEIVELRNEMTAESFEQEIAADFNSFVGKIYGEFDEEIHVKKHTFNPAWPNYIAFDWGFVAPLAAIEFQIDPWDNIRIWREHYKSYTILGDHIKILKGRTQPVGYHLDLCFGDAADPAAAAEVSEKFRYCIADPDSKLGQHKWREGVDLVKSFLKSYQVGEADEYGTPLEAPKLTVDPSCKDLIREFSNYRAKEGAAGRDPQDVAPGVDDHGLDALRYGLMHIYKLGATRHLYEALTVTPSGLSIVTDSMPSLIAAGATSHGTFFSMNQEF